METRASILSVVLSGRLNLRIITNVVCILMLATGSCGNEQQSKTGSSLSHILWRNRNAFLKEQVDCSITERFFYSTILPSGVCNNGKKWTYKEQDIIPTVNCPMGYMLIGGSCVKDCIPVQREKTGNNSTAGLGTANGNSTILSTEGLSETSTSPMETGVTDVTKATESSTEIRKTGVTDETETKDENRNEECINGCYGDICQFNCLCENNSTCDMMTGQCTCKDGWTGISCEKECPEGTFGANCSQTCSCDVSSCHPIDGCICRSQGKYCDTVCPLLTFGAGCSGQCPCLMIGTKDCEVLDGSCVCKPGWTGIFCDQLCPKGQFGEGCQQTCECQSNEFCIPTTGDCLCWDVNTGLNCTADTDTAVPGEPHHKAVFQITVLHIAILTGGGLLIILALVCTIVAWRRNRSHGISQYKFNNKDSTLKIVHEDLPPREDLSRYHDESDANRRTQSCKNKRKSHQGGANKQLDVLNLPTRIKSKPPSTVLGFQQYSPTDGAAFDLEELSRHSYVNLNDEDISKHVVEEEHDYERLNKNEINAPLQDYEVCVKTDRPYENVPSKKRSILGSLRKLVRKESRPDTDREHLSEDTGAGISRTSFITFNKQYK
ncbi:platelet endothelial aggregation receptor 1-like isoform X2 [Pecten maximus]|uniref:platelet endothelial aggregation receptor 1-like isoform X2 n=1 Tax=Pecten maximus TaxID=6579 RepID=UPI00145896F9|nr:platelet endothelial aggregation receptor 1-like isoform X2 [Pecten maximus]